MALGYPNTGDSGLTGLDRTGNSVLTGLGRIRYMSQVIYLNFSAEFCSNPSRVSLNSSAACRGRYGPNLQSAHRVICGIRGTFTTEDRDCPSERYKCIKFGMKSFEMLYRLAVIISE